MLVELAVTNLGVIAEARIPVGPGLTALTGETGAGKTMVVEALHLLLGGRPDPSRVRVGATEAVVEGLFVDGDDEWVIRRVVPAAGRSRAYVNGALATAAELTEHGGSLLELHGQHAQQALLSARHQRDALDQFAGVQRSELLEARSAVRRAIAELDELGGDEQARARELDLLRYQANELTQAGVQVGEDEQLAAEEQLLANAVTFRDAGLKASALLLDDRAAADAVATALHRVRDQAPYTQLAERLSVLAAELSDVGHELRTVAEGLEPDEERLADIHERQALLRELCRKYGPTPADVVVYTEGLQARIHELESHDDAIARCEAELAAARVRLADVAQRVGDQRRAATGALSEAIERVLRTLALPDAQVQIQLRDTDELPGAGEAVEFLLSSNPGTVAGPLAKVASGGELSRVMLSLRLVLSGGPATMVFDEIDAGIGGSAATAVGAALSRLARTCQVIVVTHLPQVAAYADHQIVVTKSSSGGVTATTTTVVDGDDRVIELSRMLSGSPDSQTAREHAAELLGEARQVQDVAP